LDLRFNPNYPPQALAMSVAQGGSKIQASQEFPALSQTDLST